MLFHRANLVSYIKFILIFFLLIPCGGFSQGISNFWLSGYSSGSSGFGGSNIDFKNGFADTSTVQRPMSFLETNSNISDSLGNLLFYCNGIYIANANNDTMVNGSGLNPNTYTSQATYGLEVKQGNLILRKPDSFNLYYLFHETLFRDQSVGDYRVSELYYSIIDMSLDSGRGVVTQKNVILLSDTLTIGSITACKHANGRDWWIVFHKSQGRRYYEYLFTPNGLLGPFVQDIGYSILPRDWSWQSCFSPDGFRFASIYKNDTFDLMDFDRCTGLFSNCISTALNDSGFTRGISFSPNSEKLYVSSSNYVYQYNLATSPLDSSKIKVITFDKFAEPIPPFYVGYYLEQLACDGKIYINSKSSTRWMTVINDPDSSGLSCNILDHGFLLPTVNAFTIPNFPNYFLGKEIGSICDSLPLIINHSTSQQQRISSNIVPLRIISDCRGEAIVPIKDDKNERLTYFYFLKKTLDSLIRK